MASFQTFFRTIVMLATLGLVAKAWYLYGPSVEEMKKIGSRVAEVTSQTWNEYWQKPADGSLADDPRWPRAGGAPAPFVPQGTPIEPIPHDSNHAVQPTSSGTVQLAGGVPAEIVPLASPGPSSAWPATSPPEPTRLPPDNLHPADPADSQLSATLQRLAQLGMRDQQLSTWGSGGKLMRFSCSMPWASSPAYSQHFEAVAASPLEAVQQVAAEIDAWRNGQR